MSTCVLVLNNFHNDLQGFEFYMRLLYRFLYTNKTKPELECPQIRSFGISKAIGYQTQTKLRVKLLTILSSYGYIRHSMDSCIWSYVLLLPIHYEQLL